ncbi:hypothetical protein DER46DRAFT_654490 [Fusarium sp. MPI-SDFR-AT-0072]|nr:hypothetical protein DER46DRAFT_654490 [Fusarium sp. MPI-SDFR-AT-0072]
MSALQQIDNCRRFWADLIFSVLCSDTRRLPTESIQRRNTRLISRYPDAVDQNARDGILNEVPTEVINPLDPHFRDRHALIRPRDDLEFQSAEDNEQEGEADGADNDLAFLYAQREEEEEEEDVPTDMDTPDEFYWGYKVHERWAIPTTHSNPKNLPLSRFKLLLDDSTETEVIITELNATLKTLKKNGVVTGYQGVIADFLSYLLDHVRSQLRDYDESWQREMVLCVPAIWKPKACRKMQTCLAVAMKQAKFPGVDIVNISVERLFITSEPEDAAEFVGSPQIKSGQPFVLVDAGGLHGSSYINKDFKAWLINKLEYEKYLEEIYGSINAVVETVMITHFEPTIKHNFDVCSEKPQRIEIPIPGLRDDRNLGFRRNSVVIPESVLRKIFIKRLEGVCEIVKSQLVQAASKGIDVETVILFAGFGPSISLVKFLRAKLKEDAKQNNCHVKLVQLYDIPSIPSAASSGAVYRACNKANGPERITQCSYGILRTEPFGDYQEHAKKKYTWNPHDGKAYIQNTIYWFLKKHVPPVWEYEIETTHLLDALPAPLICEEELFMSDSATESHYRKGNRKNKGAERVGAIQVDISFLRDEGLITPEEAPTNKAGKKVGARR